MVLSKQQQAETEEERRQHQILLNQEAIALLDSWLDDETETSEEQWAALQQVMRGIDAEREGGRKLFTKYLGGNEFTPAGRATATL